MPLLQRCNKFKTNPQRLVSPALGSREDYTTYYWTEDRIQIVCGCFRVTLEEFKNKVRDTYGQDEGHGANYFKWIKAVEAYIENL